VTFPPLAGVGAPDGSSPGTGAAVTVAVAVVVVVTVAVAVTVVVGPGAGWMSVGRIVRTDTFESFRTWYIPTPVVVQPDVYDVHVRFPEASGWTVPVWHRNVPAELYAARWYQAVTDRDAVGPVTV